LTKEDTEGVDGLEVQWAGKDEQGVAAGSVGKGKQGESTDWGPVQGKGGCGAEGQRC